MRPAPSIAAVVSTLLVLVSIGAEPFAQGTKPYGAATPQEAVAALKRAVDANDYVGAIPLFPPESLKELANEAVSGVLMVLAFSDPDDPMPGGKTPSKAELDAKRKSYRSAVDLSRQTLKPYGLDTTIGKPVLAADTQKTIDAAIAKADNVVLITSLFATIEKIGPMLGMKKDAKPAPVMRLGTVTGYSVAGDKATARDENKTVNFIRVDGRWYIVPPPSGSGGPSAAADSGAAPPAGSPQGRQASAPKPAASGTQPEIVVGGIQVAKVVMSSDDFSAKPFHSDNGTRIVLWIKMPANQGLIEIDEDTSLLQHFGDDKGTDLGGKFGSFPEEFKDGTGGVIEIASSGVPAAGAVALVAEGSVSLTVATGTRKTRVAKVRLQNDQKFSFDKAPITIAEVQTDGDSQTFTLKLARQVMTGIKNVAFFDERGQPLESRRTSSGYMNDDAEMGFAVKTAAKILTIEFEAWQGQRTIKVPFKVKAGLGLN